jgi:mono/diheme cytochrome c family protein
MRKLIVTFVGIALSGLVVSAQGAGDAVKGKAAYADRKCATCHRLNQEDLKGGKMSTVLGDTVAKLSAADIKTWLTDAAKMEAKLPKMPVVKMSSFLKGLKPPLSDEEVANLVAYVRTLPVKP